MDIVNFDYRNCGTTTLGCAAGTDRNCVLIEILGELHNRTNAKFGQSKLQKIGDKKKYDYFDS